MGNEPQNALDTCGWCDGFREHRRPLYFGEAYCKKNKNYTVSGDTCGRFGRR